MDRDSSAAAWHVTTVDHPASPTFRASFTQRVIPRVWPVSQGLRTHTYLRWFLLRRTQQFINGSAPHMFLSASEKNFWNCCPSWHLVELRSPMSSLFWDRWAFCKSMPLTSVLSSESGSETPLDVRHRLRCVRLGTSSSICFCEGRSPHVTPAAATISCGRSHPSSRRTSAPRAHLREERPSHSWGRGAAPAVRSVGFLRLSPRCDHNKRMAIPCGFLAE